jgi:hypothetical protein
MKRLISKDKLINIHFSLQTFRLLVVMQLKVKLFK